MVTWVLLRGLTRESRHWGDFVVQLQQVFPHSRLVALDLAGNGQRNQQQSPSRVQDMVRDARAQLVQAQIKPPYHLLAMSLGAMVSVAWAHAHPHEIAAQVLINTSLRPLSPFYQRLHPANYGAMLRLFMTGAEPETWERFILRVTSNRSDESVLPAWLAIRRANPVSRRNALRQLMAAARFKAPTVPPLTPTLLLSSRQDRLVSANCSQVLARHWLCALYVHPDAGHDLPQDDGPWVTQRVQEWLSASAKGSSSHEVKN